MKDTSGGVTEAGLVFELLEEAVRDGHLARYTRGRGFDVHAILCQLQHRTPGLPLAAVTDTLSGQTPAGLAALLQARQWLRPRPSAEQLRASLDALGRRLPLLACVPRHRLAAWVNQYDPAHYCTTAMVVEFVERQAMNAQALDEALDRLSASGHLALFANISACGLRLSHLRNELALAGIGVRSDALQSLLRKRPIARLLADADLAPADYCSGPAALQQSLYWLTHEMGLTPGDDMPPWDRFLAQFQRLFCKRRRGRPAQNFHGGGAMSLYMELELTLAPRSGTTAARAGQEDRDAASAQPGAGTPPPQPSPPPGRWNDYDRDPEFLLSPSQQVLQGGLFALACAIGNALQDPPQVDPLGGVADRPAALETALDWFVHAPGEYFGPRSTPDGQPWTLLQLPARHWRAAAPCLLDDLDMAVVQRGEGQFVALRRSWRGLWLLLASHPLPMALPKPRELALADGRFTAALPAAACHGALGRQVSYQAIAGFAAACDAIADLDGGEPPLDDFAAWLDGPLGPVTALPHATLDALRGQYHRFIAPTQVAAYLLERRRQMWLQGLPLPPLLPQDEGASLLAALDARTSELHGGNPLLLGLPGTPHLLLVRRAEGMLLCHEDPTLVALQERLRRIAATLAAEQPVLWCWLQPPVGPQPAGELAATQEQQGD
ncbi:hypothetical protein GT347_18335 [Xylophilus rhododendri]|uniref:Uncharacterized protein n=1 Tax=Xylophilus rhododendri TaxID=2697032 RepID=A0A857J6Z3_9BURK|nr:hypothetical protein [Xylophilus rhododendri]QHI99764.1 hypothetical protein GT347_18335 [Xylophilus rhododendri]